MTTSGAPGGGGTSNAFLIDGGGPYTAPLISRNRSFAATGTLPGHGPYTRR